ncbi:MAG: GNAT family acetyltransferase [Propionicimonas sp.]
MRISTLPSGLTTAAVDLWKTCGLTRPWNDPDADLTRAMVGPSSTVLAAIADEQLLGTVMVGHDGHRGWVYYLAVQAGRRNMGLGRTLMMAAESWLEQQGMPKVQLMVRSDNDAVIGFYEQLGYVDQGVVVLGRFLDQDMQALREQEQHDDAP